MLGQWLAAAWLACLFLSVCFMLFNLRQSDRARAAGRGSVAAARTRLGWSLVAVVAVALVPVVTAASIMVGG